MERHEVITAKTNRMELVHSPGYLHPTKPFNFDGEIIGDYRCYTFIETDTVIVDIKIDGKLPRAVQLCSSEVFGSEAVNRSIENRVDMIISGMY